MYKYVGISGLSPLLICDPVLTMLLDTTSLDQDYLSEGVLIQGRAHIADVGWSPLISRSHCENMWVHDPTSNMSVGTRPKMTELWLLFASLQQKHKAVSRDV